MTDLIYAQYVSNSGTRRFHLYLPKETERRGQFKTLCGLWRAAHWIGRAYPIEDALACLERATHAPSLVACRRCEKLAQKFRDPVTQLGGLVT